MGSNMSTRCLLAAVALYASASVALAEDVAITVKSVKHALIADMSHVMIAVTNNTDHVLELASITCTVLSDSGIPIDSGASNLANIEPGQTVSDQVLVQAPDTGGVDSVECHVDNSLPDTSAVDPDKKPDQPAADDPEKK
jgi:hypothetical protein